MPPGAVHQATALQLHALGDLYFNCAVDRVVRFEERSAAAAGVGPRRGAAARYAAHERAVLAACQPPVPAGAPSPPESPQPEPFFAARCYGHSAAALRTAFGPRRALAVTTEQHLRVCAEIVRKADERGRGSQHCVRRPTPCSRRNIAESALPWRLWTS